MMNLQKLNGEIVLRAIVVFIIGTIYGILDKGEFKEGSLIGDGLGHLILSYGLGLISFYIYKLIPAGATPAANNQIVASAGPLDRVYS
jgi:hypothetical protein